MRVIPDFRRRLPHAAFLVAVIVTALGLLSCPNGDLPGGGTGNGGSSGGTGTGVTGGTTGSPPAKPVFELADGPLVALTGIGMSCATSGAQIRYTTDGRDPTAASTLYDGAKKPLLVADSTWKAIALKDGVASEIASATYAVTPLYPDFDIPLAVGLRWNYRYSKSFNYAFGGTDSSSQSDFACYLVGQETVDGLPMFRLATTGLGNNRINWHYIGWEGKRLYGSVDGTTRSVILDTMLGYWVGGSYFGSASGLVSVEQSADKLVIAKGSQWSDNQTAYYPGIGTIYDYDGSSGSTITSEKYQDGTAPCAWRYSTSTVTYDYALSTVESVSLLGVESGIDVAPYLCQASVTEDKPLEISLAAPTGRIFVDMASNLPAVCLVESPGGGNPSISVDAWSDTASSVLVGSVDANSGTAESCRIDPTNGDCAINVAGLPEGGSKLLVAVLKLTSGSTTDRVKTSIPEADMVSLASGDAARIHLGPSGVKLLVPSQAMGKKIYAFAIPLTAGLDLAISMVNRKTAANGVYSYTTSDGFRSESEDGPDEPEAFYYTTTSSDIVKDFQIWEENGLEGDIIFGWGSYL